MAIEGKTETGELAHIQELRMRQIRKSGGIYAVARNLDELIAVVEEVMHNGDIE